MSKRIFKEELRNYFRDYKERYRLDDDTRVRSYYFGFREDKFEEEQTEIKTVESQPKMIFEYTDSVFDEICENCLAQYATDKVTPSKKWDNVSTT